MAFLPKDYKAPSGTSDFMKLQEGPNRFRVMAEAIIGWEGWKDGKPFRRKGEEQNITEDEVDIDEKFDKPKISHFWVFPVFDYTDKKIKIFQITQKTIMKGIESLVHDEDWGDPVGYDISIEKTKNGDKTSYSVKSYPPKAAAPEVLQAFKDSKIDLDILFGDDDSADFPTDKQKAAAKKK